MALWDMKEEDWKHCIEILSFVTVKLSLTARLEQSNGWNLLTTICSIIASPKEYINSIRLVAGSRSRISTSTMPIQKVACINSSRVVLHKKVRNFIVHVILAEGYKFFQNTLRCIFRQVTLYLLVTFYDSKLLNLSIYSRVLKLTGKTLFVQK